MPSRQRSGFSARLTVWSLIRIPLPSLARAGQAPSTSMLRIVTKRDFPPTRTNDEGPSAPVIVTLVPWVTPPGAPCHLVLPSMATPTQSLQLNMNPPPGPPARRMTTGPVPFGSFLIVIGSLAVPLQLRIASGPRVSPTSVSMSPGASTEQSYESTAGGMTRSAPVAASPAAAAAGAAGNSGAEGAGTAPCERLPSSAAHTVRTFTVAVAVFDGSCRKVARIVSVSGVGTESGAV